MRKVTGKAANALLNGQKWSSGNTAVRIETGVADSAIMSLHGNDIACYALNGYDLLLKDCGWQSNTTKERLNGILEILNTPYYISQSNFHWYLMTRDGHKVVSTWDGQAYFSLPMNKELELGETLVFTEVK